MNTEHHALKKLQSLRKQMNTQGIDAWIISSSDPHNSEYAAAHWQGRSWLSGFTGSAGTLVVLANKAALWTDGRYFLQASQEIRGSGIELMRSTMPDVPKLEDWITQELEAESTVGFDGKLFSHNQVDTYKKSFNKKQINLKTNTDLLNDIWLDRPKMPASQIFEHTLTYAGLSREQKITNVREEMTKKNATHLVISTLDDIAWLFNLRATDVECNPVFLSYALIDHESVTLYTNPQRINSLLTLTLEEANIHIAPYEQVTQDLQQLNEDSCLMLPSKTTSEWLANAIPETLSVIKQASPTTLFKAIKNLIEIKHMKHCHRNDGAAITRLINWIKKNIVNGNVTEMSLDDYLTQSRAQAKEFRGPSFPTIAGYRSNGAIIHYRANEKTCKQIDIQSLLLIDSGGQYLDGTTDITRTIACGTLTEEEKKDYTLVLKGHINLSKVRFIKGTTGSQLDVLARQPIWQAGQDYNHGTGHGVGYFLNVHEGPHNIGKPANTQALEPGMLVTNEPGIYRNGKHGVRIENIMLVTEDITTEFGEFYQLEPLTLAPIDTTPIVRSMMTQEEINWLNHYHQKVRHELTSLLHGDDLEWLIQTTEAYT